MMNKETRSYGEIAAPHIIGDGRTIEGYAIVFNQESQVMYDKERRKFFTEVIQPQAVSAEMLRGCDIKLLVNHNRERMLARVFRGVGSLEYQIDEYGVKYRTEAPNDTEGNAVLEHIRRGDYFGSSFVFSDAPDGVIYSKIDDKTYKRTVTKMGKVYDFSIVDDPAYMGTTVSARNWEPAEELPQGSGFTPEMQMLDEELRRDIENIYSKI